MVALRKTVAATLITLAGTAGVLVIATSVGTSVAQGDAVQVTVLADDSPWGVVKP